MVTHQKRPARDWRDLTADSAHPKPESRTPNRNAVKEHSCKLRKRDGKKVVDGRGAGG
jgi:hypothetical protein